MHTLDEATEPTCLTVSVSVDAGVAAVVAGMVGVAGALGGAWVGSHGAIVAAKMTARADNELMLRQTRRNSYANLVSAALRFEAKIADIMVIMNHRWIGPVPAHIPIPGDMYTNLDDALDEVEHDAVTVQLDGPIEITNIAWDVYVFCRRIERKLSEYGIAGRQNAVQARQEVEKALRDVARARGVFASNGRAHIAGKTIPLAGEPTLYTGPTQT
jgi:hypothetical protein